MEIPGSQEEEKTKQQINIEDQIVKEKAKKKQVKGPIDVKGIESLNRSDSVQKALLDSLEIPKTSSQFERDFKSLTKSKEPNANKLFYLLRIKP